MPMAPGRCGYTSAFSCATESHPGDLQVEEGSKYGMWMLSPPGGERGGGRKRTFPNLLFPSGSRMSKVLFPLYSHIQKWDLCTGKRVLIPAEV